ncbi:MAG: thiamine pyrophosphate-dependent dehydrogenase E1 component subunit alpha [Actinobacteria bacterium]|nr:thiamine pyrophosphate-dependent dehydrogenase E1 component subunit alpha [Actinomycetota bacterium]
MLNINNHKIEDNFSKLNNEIKIEMLRKMFEIRHLENAIDELIMGAKVHGSVHLCVGQEASAVGAVYAIKKNDYITSNHRGHGHCIAKGARMDLMIAEILGKKTGYCSGRGGSMHIADVKSGNLGTNGIVGGGIGVATGAALTCKLKKNNRVVLCFFGDGAANRGIFHSSLNMASIWNLPIIYVCENNVYGLSMPVKDAFNIKKISDRKFAYGIDGLTIDGNDITEVFNCINHFAEKCRNGKGPFLIESLTYRWKGHSKSDAQVYRTKEEVKSWMERDPIKKYKGFLIDNSILNEKGINNLENNVVNELKEALEFAINSPFPDKSEAEDKIYA